MKKFLTSHDNDNNNSLSIEVICLDGLWDSHHKYVVGPAKPETDNKQAQLNRMKMSTTITFQQGSIKEHGVNGVTNESLLIILEHRLRYQKEPEMALALTKIQEALLWLNQGRRNKEEGTGIGRPVFLKEEDE